MSLSCACAVMIRRSACPCMYRWVDVFARPVPVYAPVDECASVYVYVPVNVCVAVRVAVAVYVCVYASACPSIHSFIYAPEQKIEIEN